MLTLARPGLLKGARLVFWGRNIILARILLSLRNSGNSYIFILYNIAGKMIHSIERTAIPYIDKDKVLFDSVRKLLVLEVLSWTPMSFI